MSKDRDEASFSVLAEEKKQKESQAPSLGRDQLRLASLFFRSSSPLWRGFGLPEKRRFAYRMVQRLRPEGLCSVPYAGSSNPGRYGERGLVTVTDPVPFRDRLTQKDRESYIQQRNRNDPRNVSNLNYAWRTRNVISLNSASCSHTDLSTPLRSAQNDTICRFDRGRIRLALWTGETCLQYRLA